MTSHSLKRTPRNGHLATHTPRTSSDKLLPEERRWATPESDNPRRCVPRVVGSGKLGSRNLQALVGSESTRRCCPPPEGRLSSDRSARPATSASARPSSGPSGRLSDGRFVSGHRLRGRGRWRWQSTTRQATCGTGSRVARGPMAEEVGKERANTLTQTGAGRGSELDLT